MAIGDLFVLEDWQYIGTQPILNVYTYRQIADMGVDAAFSNPSGRLQQNWRDQKLPSIAACQAAALGHNRINVYNLFNTDDSYDYSYLVAGNFGGTGVDDLPTFNATGIRFSTPGRTVRDGAKRLAGIIEAAQVDGTITDPTLASRLNTMTSTLSTSVVIGTVVFTPAFQPVVIKRVKEGTPPDVTYRFPENSGEAAYANIVSGLWKFLLTSQVSRKTV